MIGPKHWEIWPTWSERERIMTGPGNSIRLKTMKGQSMRRLIPLKTQEMYLDFLKSKEDESLAKLREMVSINSFTQNPQGVGRVGKLCEEIFAPLGFKGKYIPAEGPEYGDHLLLNREGRSKKNILLVSHLDTVYTEEEEYQNSFSWREEGDRIYGPGIADIKGGTVMIYSVLEALMVQNYSLFEEITWHILLNATEEEGCHKFPKIARSCVNQHTLACLVYEFSKIAEDGTIEIVEARKGATRFQVETFGRQAHSGSGHKEGANAIWEISRVINKLQELTNYDEGITVNVGQVKGGIAINRVPDYAQAYVDLRTLSKKSYLQTREEFLKISGAGEVQSAKDAFRCSIKVSEMAGYPPWPPNTRSHKLAKLAQQCGEELGYSLTISHKSGASDGCHFWDLVQTLDGLGPLGDFIHCSRHAPEEGREQEFILRSSWTPKALLSLSLMEKIVWDNSSGIS